MILTIPEDAQPCHQCDQKDARGRCGLPQKRRLCSPDAGLTATIYKQDETGRFRLVRVSEIGKKLVKAHPMLAPLPDTMRVVVVGWHYSVCVDQANLISIIVNDTGAFEVSYSNTPTNLERAKLNMEKMNMEYVQKKVIPTFNVKKCTCKGYKRDRKCPLHGGK